MNVGAWIIGTGLLAMACWMLLRPVSLLRLMTELRCRTKGLARGRIRTATASWPTFMGGSKRNEITIIILHGFGVDSFTMLPIAKMLVQEHHRVLLPDLPGFGYHRFNAASIHNEAFMLEQLESFAAAAGASRVMVVGSSMGGALAAAWAHAHPERIVGAVLLDPAGVEAPVSTAVYTAADDENPLDIRTMADLERILELNFERPPSVPWIVRRDLVRLVRSRADHGEAIIRALEPLLRNGMRDRLEHVRQPVLLIWGEQDRIIDPSAVGIWMDGLPNAELLLLDDCGHVPWGDQPISTLLAIREFTARIAS